MTQKTANYNLEKYDATDAPNLQGQYNRSMDILDTTLKTQSNRIDAIPTPEALPEGLKAFTTALGLSTANARALGTALNHFLNRIPATGGGQYTVKNLNDTKVTAEGLPFVSTTASGE
jgi:hypothetical protein|nr:MAG TPA: hypothetical protein [Caudoviricetes sp.]